MFHYIDPFLWQLVIVPTFTIGLGVAIALHLKRLSIALDHALRLLGHGVVHVSGHPLLLYEVVAPSLLALGSRSRSSGNVRWGTLRSNDA
ncbi:MAG: hypothetical protein HZT42_01905 [Paracoccaceae bacterium]|nr:MAG: hypothetical protein HZT42_01905 [Paracoccaceae bacterium]